MAASLCLLSAVLLFPDQDSFPDRYWDYNIFFILFSFSKIKIAKLQRQRSAHLQLSFQCLDLNQPFLDGKFDLVHDDLKKWRCDSYLI
ncbi:hypothetical protein L2E82_22521 [Cichorium intybus]|uniref:Uncharacterized protein n=1 Tax=Cichorium intybus TaxID=13427 RepID=A0ACB9DYF0_CICIN|nr:hypothetical protein L2E82_22521 [Cichorium intybus]